MSFDVFWNSGLKYFKNYIDKYCKEQKTLRENYDYLAWRTGESVKSALENVAILSIMIDGKDANRELKQRKYQESPAYILIEKQKNKGKSKQLTQDEIKAEREKLFNFINNIKPKK